MAILKFFPYNPLFMITVALFLVIVQIELMHSEVFPSISAAILPIIVHAGSWIYPISVCIMTGIIAIGRIVSDKNCRFDEKEDSIEAAVDSQKAQSPIKYWLKISAAVILVAAAALYLDFRFILAPPLIVVFVELTQPRSLLRKKHGRVLSLILLAALSGVCWLFLTVEILNLPCGLFPYWQ